MNRKRRRSAKTATRCPLLLKANGQRVYRTNQFSELCGEGNLQQALADCHAPRLPFREGEFYGFRTKRVQTQPGAEERDHRRHGYSDLHHGSLLRVVVHDLSKRLRRYAVHLLSAQRGMVFDKSRYKRSRKKPGFLIRRMAGYSIAETEYGVSYLWVISRKPDRTTADNSVHPLAGYFNWKALEASGLLCKERENDKRDKTGAAAITG